ncbi:MAG: tetratricopeptide repeat protein, partial [Candidatus Hermodarchaeota archaeon]
ALEQFEKSLELREKYGDKYEVAASLLFIVGILWFQMGELDQAFKHLERALTLAKESNMKCHIAHSLFHEAVYFGFKGELDRCIMLYQQSLTLFKELNNKIFISSILNNLTNAYRSKGELERALECIEQCIALRRELGNLFLLATAHANLIHILIEKGDLKRAQEYLNQLEQMNIELKSKLIKLYILKCKAMILKTSPRIIDKGKAQEILKQILEDEDSSYELVINSLLDLCELLLFELNATNEPQILDEFQSYLSQLIIIVKNGRSYWLLAETYLLQARVSLLTLNMNKARRLFAKSQGLAEKYGLELLAIKISNEHDELLKQLKIWENFKESEASLAERIKLSRLNEQMEHMVKKRMIKAPELSDEEPVLLLIVSEGGTPFFSQSFIEDKSFEDHLFGGFFTAINSFINEKFSEGLDRASFGDHTLLMNTVSPFLMCYIYKGQSYSAQQRIKSFINELQINKDIWDNFKKYHQLNREIQLKDIPALKPLIKKVFIEKTIHLTS